MHFVYPSREDKRMGFSSTWFRDSLHIVFSSPHLRISFKVSGSSFRVAIRMDFLKKILVGKYPK